MKTYWIKWIFLGGTAVIAGAFLFTWVVMYLWNWLVPSLFSGPEIGFWQAAGILVLSKILFGGSFGRCRSKWSRHCGCGHHHGKKWGNMTDEEKAKLRNWCCTTWEEKEEPKQ